MGVVHGIHPELVLNFEFDIIMSIRVRFAPSPTGFLHIGGARTALFNWLYARHTGGTFVLRIEDTDTARNTQEAVDVIINGLKWLGLDWDEGPLTGSITGPCKGDRGPYFQSQRTQIYLQRVEELKSKDLAYEQDGAVKFRMDRDAVEINDLIVGQVHRELTDREIVDPDFVIVRSDGQPVFHLVNVIDDLEMGITHVIRGEDHLSNTAKHIALFRAFGTPAPQYAHIPLILNADGTKMSKRDQGASLMSYRDWGYVPEAVVNQLLLLGWSPKDDSQLIPIANAIKLFDLPQVLRHNARFDATKLAWLNYEYIKTMPIERFVDLGVAVLNQAGLKMDTFSPAYIQAALTTCKEKVKLMNDLPAFADFYFLDQVTIPAESIEKDFTAANRPNLMRLRETYAALNPFDCASLEISLKALAKELGIKAGALIHPLRVACTGKTVGPSLYHLMEVLGRDKVLARLDKAMNP
jgi:glutamyl-tRNA synthetase